MNLSIFRVLDFNIFWTVHDLYGIPVLTTVQQPTVQGQTNTLSADFFMGDTPLGHRQDCASCFLPFSQFAPLEGEQYPSYAVGVLGCMWA